MYRIAKCFVAPLFFLCFVSFAVAQEKNSKSTLGDGYILIAPIGDSTAYLINSDKEVVHQWDCRGGAGNSTYLLPNGKLLRTGKTQIPKFNARGGSGGLIKLIGWDGTIEWEYKMSSDKYHSHHDVEWMPNGNILVIAWEYHSAAEAIAAGRKPETLSADSLWPETILELKPKGKNDAEIVWTWRLWDHLIQQHDESKENFGSIPDHPELVNINFGIRRGGSDWIHMNAIDYNAKFDQIALSARWFDELWVIDHSTTIEEAASHKGGRYGKGGDILYRWGSPDAYFGGFPFDRKLFAQHDLRWIDSGLPGEGNFLLFNNGDRRGGQNYSSVDEFVPPQNEDGTFNLSEQGAFAPERMAWSYSDPENFSSDRISGAQRLPSGNTLICSGSQSWVFEVTPAGNRVWEFSIEELETDIRGEAGLFRAPYYAPDYSGLEQLNQ